MAYRRYITLPLVRQGGGCFVCELKQASMGGIRQHRVRLRKRARKRRSNFFE